MIFPNQTPLINLLIQQSPFYMVWLTGIIIALVKWQKHPHLSLLVLLTLAGFLVLLILNGLFVLDVPQIGAHAHWSYTQMITAIGVANLVDALLTALLWGLLLWALFGWRKTLPVQAADKQAYTYPM